MFKIGILESKDFSQEALNELEEIGKVYLFDYNNIDDFLIDKDILFVRLKYYINSQFLKKANKLKYICTPTTGLNHIDLEECKRRNVKIISLKGEYEFLSTIRATPEHTFGLVLSLLRNYKNAFLSPENSNWGREKYKGFELYGNKIGIIGFGRVGKILAKYFNAFVSEVYFYDIDDSVKETNGAVKVENIETLIKKSNIVILSASYNKKYHQFFNKDYIDLLKDKYFINTARGELVDEIYLLKKIEQNYFKGVALDVIQNEQGINNLNKMLYLTKKRNFIITPHIAGATYTSMHRTEEFIVKQLKRVLHG